MLNNPFAPTYNMVLLTCRGIYITTKSEDEVLDYLSEVASNDFACPDKCDRWAMEFFQENEEEIKQ